MTNSKSMLLKVISVFMGSAFFMAAQFLIIIILARLGDAKVVGEFGLMLAITGPVYMFFTMQIRNKVTSEDSNLSSYIEIVILNVVLGTIASLVICFVTNASSNVTQLVLVYLLAKNVQLVSELVYGFLQQQEKLHEVGFSNFIKGISSTFLFFIFYYLTRDILLATFSIGLSWLFILLIYDIPKININRKKNIKDYLRLPNDIKKISYLYRALLPLGIISLLYSLNTNITRYFITYYMDTEKLGYFTALSYLMIAGNTLVGAIGQSFCNRLSRYSNRESKSDFNKLFNKLVAFGVMLGLLSTLLTFYLGELLLYILFGPEYIEYSSLLTILMAATIFRYPAEFMGYATIATKTYKNELPQLIFMLIATCICSFLLIPIWGLYGAAITLLVGSCITAIGRFAIILRVNKVNERKVSYETQQHG
ncbi:TPA: oligosaccharide flippase family protein [Bacillus mycoides]|nr:oligosaccharide flippase family protein [Bacillus mycoides]